jgi:hypothetical protein
LIAGVETEGKATISTIQKHCINGADQCAFLSRFLFVNGFTNETNFLKEDGCGSDTVSEQKMAPTTKLINHLRSGKFGPADFQCGYW